MTLPVGELSPAQLCRRLRPEFHARADSGPRILRASACNCSVVTPGDLV